MHFIKNLIVKISGTGFVHFLFYTFKHLNNQTLNMRCYGFFVNIYLNQIDPLGLFLSFYYEIIIYLL